MKNVLIETPIDINEEVKNILMATKKKQSQHSDRPRTPKKLRISTTTSAGKDSQLQNSIANPKFVALQSYGLDLSNVTTYEKQEKPRALVQPEVQLLNESRPVTDAKAIGFRPSWKCEAWDDQRANLFVHFSLFSLVFLFLFFFSFFPWRLLFLRRIQKKFLL